MEATRYADFCCGLGAYHLAFEQVNREKGTSYQCVFACDLDPGVRALYKSNHGVEPEGDMFDVDVANMPDFDILCAGFPCQPFSIAGRKQGTDDVRGTIFPRLLEVIDLKNPTVLLFENVPNLLRIEGGQVFAAMQQALEERGFSFHSKLITATDHGSPQKRRRLYLVCTRGEPYTFPPARPGPVRTVASILEPDVDDEFVLKPQYHYRRTSGAGLAVFDIINTSTNRGGRQGERVFGIDRPAPTVVASGGGLGKKVGLFQLADRIRTLTTVETLRLFGFPDDFVCHPNRNKMAGYLGNSIVVDVLVDIIGQLPR